MVQTFGVLLPTAYLSRCEVSRTNPLDKLVMPSGDLLVETMGEFMVRKYHSNFEFVAGAVYYNLGDKSTQLRLKPNV